MDGYDSVYNDNFHGYLYDHHHCLYSCHGNNTNNSKMKLLNLVTKHMSLETLVDNIDILFTQIKKEFGLGRKSVDR